jgi:hypothetical protein
MRDEQTTAELSLDEILADFNPTRSDQPSRLTGGTTITIWVSPEDKARWNRLQRMSGRRFAKKARELLLAAIELAEAKAS